MLNQAPQAWQALWGVWRGVLFEGALPRTTKELLALATASAAGRADLVSLWRDALLRRGLEAKLLDDVGLGRATSLPKRTRLILSAGARLVADPQALTEDDFVQLRRAGLGDAELAELVATCGVLAALTLVDAALDSER
ncbi:MAG: carboxymuconolactone decarboxylase family protein [Planctomycetes bacterium]|nr:carboxymuconolactone decarboxylase family protein [Planctomycetota bacterium]